MKLLRASCSVVNESSSANYRSKAGWLKLSNRERVFRMTAEQLLNHVRPALAFGDGSGSKVTVQHYERPCWETIPGNDHDLD